MNITTLDYDYPNNEKGILVIQDGGKIVNRLEFQTSSNTGSSDLRTALMQVSNTSQKIPTGNVDLAGYLYSLFTAGEMPSEKIIAELTRCNATVNQAREHLKNGRANVMSDLINRPQLGGEYVFVRSKKTNGLSVDDPENIYASSRFLAMGNCREHAVHNILIHSKKCQKGEFITLSGSEEIDHQWAESNNCVMDSWAYGPAVVKADAGSISENATREHINKETAQKWLQASAEIVEVLEAYGKDGQKLKAEIESFTKINMDFHPETSVINERLKEIINARGLATTHTLLSAVNSQIRAAGVLRSLGTALDKAISIKEATSGSDEVINAFNNRFMTGYLGQWHSE